MPFVLFDSSARRDIKKKEVARKASVVASGGKLPRRKWRTPTATIPFTLNLSDQRAKQNELIDLSSLLSHLRLLETLDVWECTIDKTRSSTMKGMRSHIMNQSTVTVLTPFRWNRLLPIKVNILCWRIISLRLPRRLSLDYRGVDLDSVRCPICDNDIENEEHLFVHCDVSINTWARVTSMVVSQV
ncbi:RNA-directed DNA polymerase, eukaryota, reverse transcriptase zinc-binding domain protein [Tanacetum coccineum]